jgi:hypothetical protein
MKMEAKFSSETSVIFLHLTDNDFVKVKLSLCLTKHYAMKAYGRMDVQIHYFLTSALVGGEFLASSSGRFTSGGGAPVPIR